MVNRCIDPEMPTRDVPYKQLDDEESLYTFSSSNEANKLVTYWMLLRHVVVNDSRSAPENLLSTPWEMLSAN